MTTNTYQALCDSVGAYEEVNKCFMNCALWGDKVCNNLLCENYDNKFLRDYPRKTSCQQIRLIILIGKELDYTVNYHNETNISGKKYHSFYVESSYVKDNFSVSEDSYPEALYALTHKLVAEGVLSKEEVAKALKGGE